MPNLEQIIRPFVIVDVTPPGVAPTAASATPSNPTNLSIGKNTPTSSVVSTSGTYAYDEKFYMHAVVKEKKQAPSGAGGGGQGSGTGGAGGGSQSGSGSPPPPDTQPPGVSGGVVSGGVITSGGVVISDGSVGPGGGGPVSGGPQ